MPGLLSSEDALLLRLVVRRHRQERFSGERVEVCGWSNLMSRSVLNLWGEDDDRQVGKTEVEVR